MSIVDDALAVTIILADPKLTITRFQIHVRPQGGGEDIIYDVLAGGLPRAAAGDTIFVQANARNDGSDSPSAFVAVYQTMQDETVQTLWTHTDFLATGASFDIIIYGIASANPLIMPNYAKKVTVNAGH